MSITIRDVAQAAGVSTATVSRALRGLPHVDPETRERVRRVAAELDYVVSPSASRLASGRTGTVAVITPFIDRWFFSTVLSGISDVLQESDVDLLVYEVGDPATSPGLPAERRLRGRVDGVIVVLSIRCRGLQFLGFILRFPKLAFFLLPLAFFRELLEYSLFVGEVIWDARVLLVFCYIVRDIPRYSGIYTHLTSTEDSSSPPSSSSS